MSGDFDGLALPGGGPILRFERDWCERHLEPFRYEWPKGSGVAMVLLFQAFCEDERVQRMAGYQPELGIKADSERLPALIAECSPLCCFVGETVIREVIEQGLEGKGPRIDKMRHASS
jgi:hypothetical protein